MAFGGTVQIADVSFLAVDFAITFPGTATAGNLLVIAEGRSATPGAGGAWGAPTGWNILHSTPINSGNVAGAAYWKISDGTETAATSIHTNIAGNGHVAFAEIEGPFAVSPLDVQAESEANLTTAVLTQSTGTTGATAQNDELALAFFAADQFQTIADGRSYSNSFTEVAIGDNTAARATGWIAKLVLSAVGTVECTFTTTDTGDEMYGQMATFKKLGAGGLAHPIFSQDIQSVIFGGQVVH